MKLLKQEHEEAVCNSFLNIYNKQSHNRMNLTRLGKPLANEPDCICSNGVAIELVGVYDNPYQAKKLWAIPRGKVVNSKVEHRLLSLENLQSEIAEKLTKLNNGAYSGFSEKIILVCNLHSPLLQDHEVIQFINSYTSFRSDGWFEMYFDEIWVSWKSDREGSWKIKKLE